MIGPCSDTDFDTIHAIINDGAEAYPHRSPRHGPQLGNPQRRSIHVLRRRIALAQAWHATEQARAFQIAAEMLNQLAV
jgi:hypothetical protein